MRPGTMLAAVAVAALLAGCGPRRGSELNQEWLVGDWAPNRECRPAEFTSLLRDGSYTAPMNASRRALGIWTFRDGVLEIGTVMRMERFRITRVSDTELRSEPASGGGTGATLYRCE